MSVYIYEYRACVQHRQRRLHASVEAICVCSRFERVRTDWTSQFAPMVVAFLAQHARIILSPLIFLIFCFLFHQTHFTCRRAPFVCVHIFMDD